jgi:hypothetical protein
MIFSVLVQVIYSIMYLIEAKRHICQKIVAILNFDYGYKYSCNFFTFKFWNYMLLKQKRNATVN